MLLSQLHTLSVRELWVFYYRHQRSIWLAFFLPLLGALCVSMLLVPRYQATAVLTVRLGAEFIYQPENSAGNGSSPASIPFDRDQIFKSEVAILNSHDIHADTVRKIGVNVLFPSLSADKSADGGTAARIVAKAIVHFSKNFRVNLERDSSVITVSYEHADPNVAVRVLDEMLRLYMQKRKSLYGDARANLAKTQAEDAHQRVLARSKTLEDFKNSHSIYSFDDERSALIAQRDEIAKQRFLIMSPALDAKLMRVEDRLDGLNKIEGELRLLEHEVSVASDEYAVFSRRLGEAQAYEEREREYAGSVRVIQLPTAPAEPRQVWKSIMMFGFMLGIMGAFMMAIWRDYCDSGLFTPEQVERELGLPVLTTLSRE